MLTANKHPGPHLRQRGLSVVELMVGVTIGLFVVAAATMLVVTQLGDNRRLLLETQVQQDLRATADIVTRDLRRVGHWGAAADGIWVAGSAAVAASPYGIVALDDPGEVTFTYSRDANFAARLPENGVVDSDELLGFRLRNGVIETLLGGSGWQALTDANTLRITSFTLTMRSQAITLPCVAACPVGAVTCPPTQSVRTIAVAIVGEATHDSSVRRNIRSEVRLRNDPVVGVCPT
jgi:type IV pilus assembly protein PilW